MEHALIYLAIAVATVFVVLPIIASAFYRTVESGEIRLVSRGQKGLRVFRGPCKAWVIPLLTSTRVIPASAINVDIEITDQTADVDAKWQTGACKGYG